MSIRIAIDPNVRVRGNRTYAGFEDVDGDLPTVGDRVRVWEPESDLTGLATVDEVDADRRLIYLSVNWRALTIGTPTHAPNNGTPRLGIRLVRPPVDNRAGDGVLIAV